MTVIILSDEELQNENLSLDPNVQIQELGPAILVPSHAIGNVVARTNDLLVGQREWLKGLPQQDDRVQHQNKVRDAPASLITPSPTLYKRFPQPQAAILPECSGFVASASASGSNIGFASASAQFVISLSSVSSTASATIASLQAVSATQSAALQSASIALTSASSALASANSSAAAASSIAKSIQSSAASAISMAQASAQSAIVSAQSSANVVVQTTATFAIAQAQASISGINTQAQSKILVSMNNLKFALILTFSILGSSVITILVIYLLLRLRKGRQDRKERKREELKEKIDFKRGSDDSGMPSLSEFPMPANRMNWSDAGAGVKSSERGSRGRPSSEAVPNPRWAPNKTTYNGPRRSTEFPFPSSSDSRKTWSQDRTGVDGREALNGKPMQRRMTEGQVERSRSLRTLTYDADFPDQPPRFGSWLGDLRKNEDPLEIKKGSKKSTSRKKPTRDEDEASEIGTAF
ncbi:hypothetical protein N431DRAFT_547824 [Stipitochalara longipes BDJ]|nr:hypothetical protein N431DRAFT_547824 [Stipitochalara longipes BDJ]